MNEDDILADLPSDAFASSSAHSKSPSGSSPPESSANPSHHALNPQTLKTWVFPTNIGSPRDYQYNIVSKALFQNILVALPTGLGKTFIAATIMLNWFRWTKDAQIVFVAPTKPLVSQQVDACLNTVGIPRSETTMLTGGISPGLRAEQWASKRVFFMTPQTIVNDLKSGICDPKKIVLLVVDEAHRATGAYAYVETVKFIRRFNPHFRVLALTATPGSSVETVQEVINSLEISKVEIRTEFSIDIQQYVHRRNIETVLFDGSEEMELVMDLFSQSVRPVLAKLTQFNAYWSKDPMALSAYGLTKARRQWMVSQAGRSANMGVKGMVNKIFNVLAGLAHSVELLKYHGIGPFYKSMAAFSSCNGERNSGKYEKEILEHSSCIKMMSTMRTWMRSSDFIGHPKLEYLLAVVYNHFLDAEAARSRADLATSANTRIMIFAHFRDSAEEIVRVLDRHRPTVRSHVFIGQAASKGSDGMDQKKQLEIIHQFKSGVYNTLVATSIGEEGLDIGEVDLIICYDSSASPIRMLQRMGRTGRKRAGQITLLLMRGKEESSFTQAKDNYKKMQEMIASGTRFVLRTSSRILPKYMKPAAEKRAVNIPPENSQTISPLALKANPRPPKRRPKKFHMPDGVETGFLLASSLQKPRPNNETGSDLPFRWAQMQTIPELEQVLLGVEEEKDLDRRYRNGRYDHSENIISAPCLENHPHRQRALGPVRYVRHGRATRSFVRALNAMQSVSNDRIDEWRSYADNDILDEEDHISMQRTELKNGTIQESDTDIPELLSLVNATRKYRNKRQLEIGAGRPASGRKRKKKRAIDNSD